MDEKQLQLFEKIDLYLSGELQGDERKAFEQKLQEDSGLSKEVDLHRRLDRVMEDQPKQSLREKLQQLREKHDNSGLESSSKGDGPRRRNILLAAAAIVAAVAGIVLLINFFSDPAFSENAALEAQLGDTDGMDGIDFSIAPSFINRTYRLQENGTIAFQLVGELKTVQLTDNSRFLIRVFNNENELVTAQPSPDSDMPIAFEDPLEGEGALAFGQSRTYPFRFGKTLKLERGLYYYTISLEGEEDVLYVGKFEVK